MQLHIRFVLILSASLFWSAAVNADTAKPIPPKLVELAKNVNAFSTFETYLDAHRDIGLISTTEHAAILSFLELKKVNGKTSLKPGKVDGDKISFGQASLTERSPGIWVTQDGVRLKMDDYKTADEAFRAVYSAMTERKSAGFDSLVLPRAYAFGALEAAQSALVAVPYHALKGYVNVVLLGIAPAAMTAVSAVVSPMIRIAGYLNSKGSITCKGRVYVVHGGFMKPDMQQVYKEYEEYRNHSRKKLASGEASIIDPYVPELEGFFMAEMKFMEQVWNPERPKDEQRVDEKFVKKTFGGKVEACNPKNADKVSLTMKDEALQIAAAALRASNKASQTPGTKPAEAAR